MSENSAMKTVTVDIGTTTLKCALFENGVLKKYFGKEYPIYTKGKSVTQDSEDWRRLISEGIKSLGDLRDVKGISISSQGITILPVDKNGAPISHALSWLDTSAGKELDEFKNTFGEDFIFDLTGKFCIPEYSVSKIKKLVDSGVNAYKYLMPSDYIYFLLTGEYFTDYTMASGTMLFDIHNRRYDKKLLDFCGITEEQLATPVEMGEMIGTVTAQAEKEFGLPEGTPVIMGAQDQKIAAYACELGRDIATVSVGTSTAVSVLSKPKKKMPTFTYNSNDLIYEAALNTTGAAIKWLRNLAFESYEEMNTYAEAAGDSGGVTFRSDFDEGASISNLMLSVDKGHLVNALYEDIARRIKEIIPENVSHLVLFGGGAKSKYLCNVISNVTNCTITVPESVETALAGADLLVRNYYNRRKI